MFDYEKEAWLKDLKEYEFRYIGVCKMVIEDDVPRIINADDNPEDSMHEPDDNVMYHVIRDSNTGNIPDWIFVTDFEKFMLFSGEKEHSDGSIKVRYSFARDMTDEEVPACKDKFVALVESKYDEIL